MKLDLSNLVETESQAVVVAKLLEDYLYETREVKTIPIQHYSDEPWMFEHPSFRQDDEKLFWFWLCQKSTLIQIPGVSK